MDDQSRRRARFRADDPSHDNNKLGWAYPPGTYEPESGFDEGPEWIFAPDDADAANFAPLMNLDFDVDGPAN